MMDEKFFERYEKRRPSLYRRVIWLGSSVGQNTRLCSISLSKTVVVINMVGIYKITNLINQKSYIGQSIHIERRWQEHCRPSASSIIAKAIRKYSQENFSFEILEECDVSELNQKEAYYIAFFNTVVPYGYNIEELSEEDSKTSFTVYDKATLELIINDIKESQLTFTDIAKKYSLNRRTIIRINEGEVHFNKNENYPLRPLGGLKRESPKCAICGKEISSKATICSICSHKTDRPSRIVLKDLIRNTSFCEIGRVFNVSDNTIKKWCDFYNLPRLRSSIKKIDDLTWQQL